MADPPATRSWLVSGVLIMLATALFCELGMWLLRESGRNVALIWPAAGLCAGIFYRFGARAFPWVALGHMVVWWRFPFSWSIALVPLLYPLEAWLASYLGLHARVLRKPDRSAMDRTAWRMLIVPWLAGVPCAFLIGWIASLEGRFPMGNLPMTIARISMAHVHGMIAFGPLTAHLLRRDFNFRSRERSWRGVIAVSGAMALMVLAFTNFFQDVLGLSAAAYLPFPFIIMAGVSLRPPMTAVFLAVWCMGTSTMTSLGAGPFHRSDGWGQPLELGIYNLIICSTAYLISVGSTRFIHQLSRNELSLEAAGVELWEWSAREGLHTISGDRRQSRVHLCAGGLLPFPALALLTGRPDEDLEALPERWKQRIEPHGNHSELLMSSGRVVSRSRDGLPQQAIGLLQDLSAIRKAEEALIALGHQRAQLKGLQTRLNPHFLFNALNAIRALIHLDPKQASEAVTTLARLLRANLRNTDRPLIPLADEMQLVTDLLTVSGMRFGDRLKTRISVQPIAEDGLVPPMIVFNLVENALVHGIEKNAGSGTISLDAKVTGEDLVLSITNPGRLRSPLSPGIGTLDARQRLELIFGTAGRFELSQSHDNTVLAEIVIPFRDHESIDCR